MTDTRFEPDVEQDWGPTVSGRRRSRVARVLGWLLVLLLVVPLAFAVLVGLYASSRIERVPVANLAGSGRPLHVLVVGSDSREDLTRAERAELSTGSAPGGRTDTVFVMTIAGGDVALLAFPRDLFVTRCDGSQGRINGAVVIDGPGCLVQTVRDVSGLPIRNYLSVSFGGFRDVVDAVDGVELCLEQPITDRDAGIDLPAGCQNLHGPDALGYVRVRKIDNDLERIERQQQFMGALADELASSATLLNPIRLLTTAGEIGDALTADEGLGPFDLTRMAIGMRGLATGSATTYTVPTVPDTVGGADVLVEVEAEAEPLYDRFRDGSILDTVEPALTPEDVEVAVLNGAGVAGLAGRTAEELEARGYVVTEVGNADLVEATVIRYPPDDRAGAELLARDLPGPVALEESSVLDTVTLVLGDDATPAAE